MTVNNTLYSNNARTLLSAGIVPSSVTIPVTSTAGFPTISAATDFFFITLDDGVNIEIVKVTGKTGTSFTGCVRGQEGTTAQTYSSATTKAENRLTAGSISKFARLTDRLADYVSVDSLPAAFTHDGNSCLCTAGDPNGTPIVGTVSGTKWRFLNYPDVVRVATVGAGTITASAIPWALADSYLIDTTARTYIIQFTSGTNLGLVRFITGTSSTGVSWGTALPSAPLSTDTYEIYRASAAKVPTGGGSDRIFFENENTVWSNYSIPSRKNAVSAGPVSVNPGVTVTIPAGSSWSIV